MSEMEVRGMRDAVFGQTSTDRNWEACGERWMRGENVAWLVRKVGEDVDKEQKMAGPPPTERCYGCGGPLQWKESLIVRERLRWCAECRAFTLVDDEQFQDRERQSDHR